MRGPRGASYYSHWRSSFTELYPLFNSSGSRDSSEDEDTDEEIIQASRGRANQEKPLQQINGTLQHAHSSSLSARNPSPKGTSSGDSTVSGHTSIAKTRTFARSRSPAVVRNTTNLMTVSKSQRHMSPSVARNLRPNGVVPLAQHTVLPARIMLQLRFPLTQRALTFTIDARKLGESALLLISLLWAAHRISSYPTTDLPFVTNPDTNNQQALRKTFLIFRSWHLWFWPCLVSIQ